MQISVVVITYEPSINKLVSTLTSIINQKGVTFEIIVSDDGSQRINFSEVEPVIRAVVSPSIPLTIVKNRQNSGTVLNIQNACRCAKGEYIKIISPGDLLFDNDVLKDLYDHATENPQQSFFFGRAAYYSNDESLKTYSLSTPLYPEIYNKKSHLIHKIAMMHKHGPVGASYFYKTVVFVKYLDCIANHVKFTEDYTTSILYILDGGNLSFVDRKVVWYEYGHGLSTGNIDKWMGIYEQDCAEFYNVARRIHPDDKCLVFRFGDKRKRLLHPMIIACLLWVNCISSWKRDHITNSQDQIDDLIDKLQQNHQLINNE